MLTARLSSTRAVPALILLGLLCMSVIVMLVSQGQDWSAGAFLLRENARQHQWSSWLWFSLAAIVSQLLVVPSGSALMLFGGFLLGAPAATIIFTMVQLCSTVVLVGLGRRSGVDNIGYSLARWSTLLEGAIASFNRVPLSLGIVLRLFPILPSAVACLLSVVFTIPLRTFLLATALVGWIRPLLFASAGALLPSLLEIEASRSDILVSSLWPALLLFFSGLLLLLFRIWVTRQMGEPKKTDI